MLTQHLNQSSVDDDCGGDDSNPVTLVVSYLSLCASVWMLVYDYWLLKRGGRDSGPPTCGSDPMGLGIASVPNLLCCYLFFFFCPLR